MRNVEICIDKRTEVMSVLLYISNYRKEYPNLINYNRDIAYVNEVYNTFSKFSNHKAVALLNEIVEKQNFCYDAPYVLVMQLNEDLSVGKLLEYPFKNRLKSSPVVLEFMESVKDFVNESGFEKFFEKHAKTYEKWISEFKETFKADILAKFEDFYQINTDRRYVINLLPMTNYGGMYYDYRNKDEFVVHYRNKHENEIKFGGNGGTTSSIFYIFTTSLIRQIIEEKNLKVPMTKEFEDKLKNSYTSINNVQYVCFEIANVLEAVFHDELCPDGEKRVLEKINPKNVERVRKIYDMLKVWRSKKVVIDECLQEVLNLF